MRFRVATIAAIAILTFAPICPGADDLRLSADFLKPAGDYLQVVRDCSVRILADSNASCDYQDILAKTESVATTSGDKAVFDNLNTWAGMLVLYAATTALYDPAAQAKNHSNLQHVSDVCSAEIGKALQDKAAPEKSACHDLLQNM